MPFKIWFEITSNVELFCFASNVSPTQIIGIISFSNNLVAFSLTSSFFSLKYCLLSECPTIQKFTPNSVKLLDDISPVKAPV